MKDIIFSLNVVLPIILIIVCGYLVKRLNIISKEVFSGLNKICFHFFLPISLFKSVYNAASIKDVKLSYVLFVALGIFTIFIIAYFVIKFVIKDDKKQGTLLQGLVRSNYAIIGIPLAGAIAGEGGETLASIIAIVTIPIFNVLATISLIIYLKEEKEGKRLSSIFKKILTNPLLQGIFFGLVCIIIRNIFEQYDISFRLSKITFLYGTIEKLAAVATPLALFSLGGLFEFSYTKKLIKIITPTVIIRLVINPGLIFLIASLFFNFNSSEYAVLISVFAAPIAVSSAVMAKEMNNDSDLANQLVVWTTIFSSITIFLIVYIFRLIGIF